MSCGETGVHIAREEAHASAQAAVDDLTWLRRTKVSVPDRVAGHLERTELMTRANPTKQRLTLLRASGGFGKTTLLAECCRNLAQDGVCVAWISLDEQDEPQVLDTYLAFAFEHAGMDIVSSLRSVELDPGDTHRNRTDLLIRAVEAHQQFPLEVRTRVVAGFRKKFFVDFRAGFGTIGPCPTDWTKAMARKAASRKELGAAGLLGIARRCFGTVADPVARRGGASLADCLMSGLAVYGLKYASLPEFDEAARGDDAVRSNLRRLYGVSRVPSDTRMRERLDEVDPRTLRSCYRRLFAALQRGKGLEGFACLDGRYLLSVDGTGHHSSKKVHCPNCCGKHHRDGTTTYYHMMLGAVLVHPDEREVFPLAPEPIAKTDGSRKNDCERNAAKRLLADVRREHPHLKLVVVEDALASNGPHIELLGKLDMRYILGAKPGDHAFLFEWVDNTPGTRTAEFEDGDGTRHWFRWLNGAPLNDANFDLEVNFLEYREISAQGRERRFSWVTDLPVGEDNLMELMRAGRARWRIENETFNTLKNQGYAFGHNFGHGDKHLSTVLAHLMMLAFLIDQIQQRCCAVFRRARARAKRPRYLWEQVRGAFLLAAVPDWETLYALATKDGVVAVAGLPHRRHRPVPLRRERLGTHGNSASGNCWRLRRLLVDVDVLYWARQRRLDRADGPKQRRDVSPHGELAGVELHSAPEGYGRKPDVRRERAVHAIGKVDPLVRCVSLHWGQGAG